MAIINSGESRGTTFMLALGCAACFIVAAAPVAAQTPVTFTAEVPPLPDKLQLYTLASTKAPVDFFNEKLAGLKLPELGLEKQAYVSHSNTAVGQKGLVRAYVNPQSGDAYLEPNFAELVRNAKSSEALPREKALGVARSVLSDERFIPRDGTELRYADPITVMGGATSRPAASVPVHLEPKALLTIVPAVRYVGGLKVYGIGSHAVVSIAGDGSIVGALRRWRTASPGAAVTARPTTEQVRATIGKQLRPLVSAKGTLATVDTIEVAYYDGNAKYLQPAYRFEATVRSGNRRVSAIRVAGFVPIGKVLEPIPDLAAPAPGKGPGKPPTPQGLKAAPGDAPTAGDFTLGEYANRDWPSDGGYVSMSYAFLNGLTFLNSIFPGSTPPATRTQWYEAWPWEVVGASSKYYMNAVNVAYTVPHGNWLLNTTLRNNADFWFVTNIGTGGNPGYGHAAGGVLATWVIMSCEVIPSYYDRQQEAGGSGNGFTAFDAWWPVFQGMHNAIGFRTIMFYPDTALNWGFGFDASLGGDLNAAWFQEVAAHEGGVGTYANGHLTGNPQSHYDRASTMIDARNLGQSIYSVSPQSAASTLWNFWMGD